MDLFNMLDNAQCEFLMANDNIQQISEFFSQYNLVDIRITVPLANSQRDKIVFLVSDKHQRDGYTICKILNKLKKHLGSSSIDILIEENIGMIFSSDILGKAIPFTFYDIQEKYIEISKKASSECIIRYSTRR